MESPIDEKYRLLLLEHYLGNAQEVTGPGGNTKWQFVCPFCGPLGRTEGKKKHRKAALLWNSKQHSWVFYCAKKGCLECMGGKTFSNLISALNPALGEANKRYRRHFGTVGKGHNCKAPQSVIGITTMSYGMRRSKRLLKKRGKPGFFSSLLNLVTIRGLARAFCHHQLPRGIK